MIVFQYRFRITSVAAVIGVVAILVCALLSRFWPASLTAYLLQKNESPLLRSIQILPDPDLRGIAPAPEVPDPATQARTAYYPFRALGLSNNVGVSLIGLTAHFNSLGQKPMSLVLVFAEHSLGPVVRTFHIEHFRPAELTLQAWEQRGLLPAPE